MDYLVGRMSYIFFCVTNFKFDGVMDMKIREVNENKKQFISLLLLADEQESMVDRYLEKGNMYVLEDGNVKAECVVTDEGNEILEIKNIAVNPENQGKGYGKALIDFLASKYADEYSVLQVGTGDSPLTVPFYEKCGFVRSHNIPNFFTDNYDHPIYECGVQLIDMVYLQRCLFYHSIVLFFHQFSSQVLKCKKTCKSIFFPLIY